MKKYVYCSGPLFCPEEIGCMTAISQVLEEAGYGTFLPHRDGLEAHVMKFVNSPINVNFLYARDFVDKAMFALDIYQVVECCDYFVFNMNGRVPDEGGIVEAAVAFSTGKPVILYKNDYRSAFNGSDNSMLTGLTYSSSKVSEIQKIPKEIEKIARKLKSKEDSSREKYYPIHLQETLDFGRKVWSFLEKIRGKTKHPPIPELIEGIVKLCKESAPIASVDNLT
ncbi:MAG: nucleoside 2-deoxyribosyltransferase [bacterium]|jgi:nucleoside 2-deoxyribosyltransferase